MTPKQRACLNAIEALTVDGVAPTYEDLRVYLGLSSKSGVHRLIHGLRERGLVTVTDHSARSIRITRHNEIPVGDMARAALGCVQHCLEQRKPITYERMADAIGAALSERRW